MNIAGEDFEGTKLIRRSRHLLKDHWEYDEAFYDKFFPITSDLLPSVKQIRSNLYNDDVLKKKWKGVPKHPSDFRRLITPLTNLFNSMLILGNISDKRRLFLDTHNVKIVGVSDVSLSPAIFLAGAGPEFATLRFSSPYASYFGGIAAIELCLDSADETVARDRLAVSINQIFCSMENRRFAYGLVITESNVTAYMFDRSGVLYSPSLRHREYPEQFAALILGLAADGPRIGIDETCTRNQEEDYIMISTREFSSESQVQSYRVHNTIVYHPDIPGRGTIVWRVSKVDSPGSTYVIKDSWIKEERRAGWQSEASLLKHAQESGVTKGLVQIHYSETVRRTAAPDDYDSVLRNRKFGFTSDPAPLDRSHIRIVLKTFGIPLLTFPSCRDLLVGFHDAVAAHRALYEKAGILHRDISPGNIILNPDGEEGNRGFLLDLDNSTRIRDVPLLYANATVAGTLMCKSRNVLRGGLHTYVDDLESFYYVLIFMILSFDAPGVMKQKTPSIIEEWSGPKSLESKQKHFSTTLIINPPAFMGASFIGLATNMHIMIATHEAIHSGRVPTEKDAAEDYPSLLEDIRYAIDYLDENPPQAAPKSTQHLPQQLIKNPTAEGATAGVPKKRRRLRIPVPPRPRSRRKTAKYSV